MTIDIAQASSGKLRVDVGGSDNGNDASARARARAERQRSPGQIDRAPRLRHRDPRAWGRSSRATPRRSIHPPKSGRFTETIRAGVFSLTTLNKREDVLRWSIMTAQTAGPHQASGTLRSNEDTRGLAFDVVVPPRRSAMTSWRWRSAVISAG